MIDLTEFYSNKRVLVTGGTGLIGIPLVTKLVELNAEVTVASLDNASRAPDGCRFISGDLRDMRFCLNAVEDQEIVFQLAGIKGSPKMCAEKPYSFMTPTVLFSFNMLEAARQAGVSKFMVTSSIGVYEPTDVFVEDSVWNTFPSPNDWYAGWAKRLTELQAMSLNQETSDMTISIVRPANVYGEFDNFDPANAMVIPSLIAKYMNTDVPFEVWGDGTPIRDFIHAADVAKAMLLVVAKGIKKPVNIGNGNGNTIKDVVDAIEKAAGLGREVNWRTEFPAGDHKRVMDISRLVELCDFAPDVSLYDGIARTIDWFKSSSAIDHDRYNAFTENS